MFKTYCQINNSNNLCSPLDEYMITYLGCTGTADITVFVF